MTLTTIERDVLEDIAAGNSHQQRYPVAVARAAVTRLHRKGAMADNYWPHTSNKVTAKGRQALGLPAR